MSNQYLRVLVFKWVSSCRNDFNRDYYVSFMVLRDFWKLLRRIWS